MTTVSERFEAIKQQLEVIESESTQPEPVEEGERPRLLDGASFILDIPTAIPAVWGNGDQVLWAEGESLMLVGPPGVGKTTIAHQILRGRLGLDTSLFGLSIAPTSSRVLYLAMDRPAQIARAAARVFRPEDRDVLAEKLIVWKGPPERDLAKSPTALTALCIEAGADTVILDSLKDAALGLTEDDTGAAYNRARQYALTNGIQVMELHHQVKRSASGGKPDSLADVYGSAWITAGTGSVVLIWGDAGDVLVELKHLKQPAETLGPWRVRHDHTAGRSEIFHSVDLLHLAGQLGGTTARTAAMAIYETDKPAAKQLENARRRLKALVTSGHLVIEQAAKAGDTDVYRRAAAVAWGAAS